MAKEAFAALKDEFIVVLAGYPSDLVEELKASGMENFIHVKSNVLEELKRYQHMLGIKND
jgi:methylmalonyl-CoA mutase